MVLCRYHSLKNLTVVKSPYVNNYLLEKVCYVFLLQTVFDYCLYIFCPKMVKLLLTVFDAEVKEASIYNLIPFFIAVIYLERLNCQFKFPLIMILNYIILVTKIKK